MKKKKVLVFTGNRAEYGLQLPVIKALQNSKKINCQLMVSGSHLDKKFGNTIKQIIQDGFKISCKIKLKNRYSNLLQTPNLISQAVDKFSKYFFKLKPDILLINADRTETFAAAIAATQMNIATYHIEGGDNTNGGLFDDSVRHAITKLSHIHFATNDKSYQNILKLGEEKWRVYKVGLPINDNIYKENFAKDSDLIKKLKLDFTKPIVIFTQHSNTLELKSSKIQLVNSLKAIKYFMNKYDLQVIATYPNNDLGHNEIIKQLIYFSKKNRNFKLYKSLGTYYYHSLISKSLKNKIAVVGNSSSGIKEAIAFKCPVVNIGSRQDGRLKPKNVLDTNYDILNLKKNIYKALFDKRFKLACKKSSNPYYKKNTGRKIASIIEKIKLGNQLLKKKIIFN